MKVQTIPAGTVLKFMNSLPVELVQDTQVHCETDLGEWQDLMISDPKAGHGKEDDKD